MYPDFDKICARTSSLEGRAFLDRVKVGDWVTTDCYDDGSSQYGTVKKIIRDKYGVPVCLQVICEDDASSGRRKYDYISVDRVLLFASDWDFPINNADYSTFEEEEAIVLGFGYVWNGDKGCYVHPETGDEICW